MTLDTGHQITMYRQMVRIREFEERVKRTFTDHPGVIRGHTHLADGAEASIVGSIAAMRPGDQAIATYRCHGYPIALGSDTSALMAEIYGRVGGICGGYGGSMHLADIARGFLGPRRSWRRTSHRAPARPTRRSCGGAATSFSPSSVTERRSKVRSTSR